MYTLHVLHLIDMGEQVIVMIETSLFLSEIHMDMEEPCLDSPQIDPSLLWCLFLLKYPICRNRGRSGTALKKKFVHGKTESPPILFFMGKHWNTQRLK